jgi:hypothetical protein
MIQREGRILRKGNENEAIEIYRYTTDGSFDAYSWQLLEAKQKMIRDLLSGAMPKRMCEEMNDVVLNYAEVKALAVGNPLLKERVEVANELNRIYTLQKKFIENHQKLEFELLSIPDKAKNQAMLIQEAKMDLEFYEANKRKYEIEERNELRKLIFKNLISEEFNPNLVKICEYQGFNIYLPPNNNVDNMRIILEKNGKYTIDMGNSELGILVIKVDFRGITVIEKKGKISAKFENMAIQLYED